MPEQFFCKNKKSFSQYKTENPDKKACKVRWVRDKKENVH